MDIEVARKRFTVDEYHRMGEAGVFHPEARLELIEGEIIEMSPVGTPHIAAINRTNALFAARFAGRAMVSVQNPVVLSDITEPQPDLLLAPYRDDFYATERLSARHAILAVEVSDSTLRYDRDRKMPLYAQSGVRELWIVNLRSDVILVFREPADGAYRRTLTPGRGDTIAVAAFPEDVFRVEDVIGQLHHFETPS